MEDDTIIDLYVEYWVTHIKPIKDSQRSDYFTRFLLDIMHRRYGFHASLDLGFRLLEIVFQETVEGNAASDT